MQLIYVLRLVRMKLLVTEHRVNTIFSLFRATFYRISRSFHFHLQNIAIVFQVKLCGLAKLVMVPLYFAVFRTFYHASVCAAIFVLPILSVRPSVRPSRCGIVSKRMPTSSIFFRHPIRIPGFLSSTAVKNSGEQPQRAR